MNKVIVRLMQLPYHINAFTVMDENDDYNIYINARLTCECRSKAYMHELRHIKRNDFHNFLPIKEAENSEHMFD